MAIRSVEANLVRIVDATKELCDACSERLEECGHSAQPRINHALLYAEPYQSSRLPFSIRFA